MKKTEPLVSRILLVDESPGCCARKIILMDHGYEVETAESGEEACELFQNQHFDIVVTDFRMKDITGIDLIRTIRAYNTPARIILLSGLVDGLGLSANGSGADEIISKSNKEVPELLRAVKKLSIRPRKRSAARQDAPTSLRKAQAG